ncbi:MAG: hypothetical protein JO224_00665 [Pelomonas sp.]|nr:hypothetical protein [Roseateles sp.]
MRRARRFVAVVSGVLLYAFAILISTIIDKDLLFVPMRQMIQTHILAVLAVAGITASVVFVVALGWAFVTLRPRQGDRRLLSVWCIGGIVVAWMASLVVGLFALAIGPADHRPDLTGLLLYSGTPPFWGLLNVFAVFAGATLASLLASRALPAAAAQRRQPS